MKIRFWSYRLCEMQLVNIILMILVHVVITSVLFCTIADYVSFANMETFANIAKPHNSRFKKLCHLVPFGLWAYPFAECISLLS